jgi:hypothetical protein
MGQEAREAEGEWLWKMDVPSAIANPFELRN